MIHGSFSIFFFPYYLAFFLNHLNNYFFFLFRTIFFFLFFLRLFMNDWLLFFNFWSSLWNFWNFKLLIFEAIILWDLWKIYFEKYILKFTMVNKSLKRSRIVAFSSWIYLLLDVFLYMEGYFWKGSEWLRADSLWAGFSSEF